MNATATLGVRTGPISADDPARMVPTDKWFNLTLARRTKIHICIPYDCRSLLDFVAEAERLRMWEHTGHADLKAYIRDGLEIDPELIDWAKLGLAVIGREQPVNLKTAEEIGKAVALARRQTDPEDPAFVDPAGAKGIGKRVSNTDALPRAERNSKPGTLRRLARSRPDLLARVETGELSAHAAAIAAGIRKPMRSIPIATPEDAIRALLRVFTVTDLAQALGRAA